MKMTDLKKLKKGATIWTYDNFGVVHKCFFVRLANNCSTMVKINSRSWWKPSDWIWPKNTFATEQEAIVPCLKRAIMIAEHDIANNEKSIKSAKIKLGKAKKKLAEAEKYLNGWKGRMKGKL